MVQLDLLRRESFIASILTISVPGSVSTTSDKTVDARGLTMKGLGLRSYAYLGTGSQVAQNNGPLHPEVAQNPLKAAQEYGPVAFQVNPSTLQGAGVRLVRPWREPSVQH